MKGSSKNLFKIISQPLRPIDHVAYQAYQGPFIWGLILKLSPFLKMVRLSFQFSTLMGHFKAKSVCGGVGSMAMQVSTLQHIEHGIVMQTVP